jgi:DNA-binding CsgD family transcriptional regulator
VDDSLAQLSDAQIACLVLVSNGKSSKEIAKDIGLSPQTVDQYLSKAANILHASNRRDAARRFVALGGLEFRKSEFKPGGVADPRNLASLVPSTQQGGWSQAQKRLAWWLPPIGGDRHDLGPSETILTILRISIFTAGAVAALIASGFWLNRLLL